MDNGVRQALSVRAVLPVYGWFAAVLSVQAGYPTVYEGLLPIDPRIDPRIDGSDQRPSDPRIDGSGPVAQTVRQVYGPFGVRRSCGRRTNDRCTHGGVQQCTEVYNSVRQVCTTGGRQVCPLPRGHTVGRGGGGACGEQCTW